MPRLWLLIGIQTSTSASPNSDFTFAIEDFCGFKRSSFRLDSDQSATFLDLVGIVSCLVLGKSQFNKRTREGAGRRAGRCPADNAEQ